MDSKASCVPHKLKLPHLQNVDKDIEKTELDNTKMIYTVPGIEQKVTDNSFVFSDTICQ